jgi:hypothetical protein
MYNTQLMDPHCTVQPMLVSWQHAAARAGCRAAAAAHQKQRVLGTMHAPTQNCSTCSATIVQHQARNTAKGPLLCQWITQCSLACTVQGAPVVLCVHNSWRSSASLKEGRGGVMVVVMQVVMQAACKGAATQCWCVNSSQRQQHQRAAGNTHQHRLNVAASMEAGRARCSPHTLCDGTLARTRTDVEWAHARSAAQHMHPNSAQQRVRKSTQLIPSPCSAAHKREACRLSTALARKTTPRDYVCGRCTCVCSRQHEPPSNTNTVVNKHCCHHTLQQPKVCVSKETTLPPTLVVCVCCTAANETLLDDTLWQTGAGACVPQTAAHGNTHTHTHTHTHTQTHTHTHTHTRGRHRSVQPRQWAQHTEAQGDTQRSSDAAQHITCRKREGAGVRRVSPSPSHPVSQSVTGVVRVASFMSHQAGRRFGLRSAACAQTCIDGQPSSAATCRTLCA